MWKAIGLAAAFLATVVHAFDLSKLPFYEPVDDLEDYYNDYDNDYNYDARFMKKDKKIKKHGKGRGTSCCVPYVANYTIVDNSGAVLYTLKLGDNGMISDVALSKVNIVANIESCPDMPATSAVVAFDGSSALRGPEGKCENYFPYTIFGDSSRQDRLGVSDAKLKRYSVDLPPGMHKVTTRPRVGSNCCGCSVYVNSAFFTIGAAYQQMVTDANEDVMINPILIGDVVEDRKRLTNPKKCFPPTITGFTILEPSTGNVLATLAPGENTTPLGGPFNNVNIRVEVKSGEDMPVRSVSVLLDGTNQDGGVEGTCDTSSPFFLVDDTTSEGDSTVSSVSITPGQHSIEAIAYPGANCCGCGTEETVTATFNVVVLDPPPPPTGGDGSDGAGDGAGDGTQNVTKMDAVMAAPPDEAMLQSQDPDLTQDYVADAAN